jgi:hypothetical protein
VQDNTRLVPHLVFHPAPTHLGRDTQRQFTRRSRDPPGVETPTILKINATMAWIVPLIVILKHKSLAHVIYSSFLMGLHLDWFVIDWHVRWHLQGRWFWSSSGCRMHLWFSCQFRFWITWISLEQLDNSYRISLSYGWPRAWWTTSMGGEFSSTTELRMEPSL